MQNTLREGPALRNFKAHRMVTAAVWGDLIKLRLAINSGNQSLAQTRDVSVASE
ncbi:MAG: hypothetical protein AAF773_01340 [Cyanobacteria bacterium P01_D01_bin.115]